MSARQRLLDAALDLFAEHGVSGTSLQMIADRLGVTKAAVYHQFPTKEEIVLAVIGPALDALASIADAAQARRTPAARRDVALRGVVDLVVAHRRVAAVMRFDPVVQQIVTSHPAMVSMLRIRELITGPDPDTATSVAASMISGGLIVAGIDAALEHLDDDTLREQLLDAANRLFSRRARPAAAARARP
ncbi:TetR/AcrR family transcriptional regulator [Dactylosporangium sucinum]|uniref:TetR family transcriptional regulator n=1 Tax=Dactylosporangium sucinum TaxID=1424081 RepID=A0A917WQP7_9ACTN|nr:TetR/AcrR family transcriptional regulator [Dactylosporangium sucinum]GGM21544.1 TetR family transcriptional regulator [Dactylosporangium sucinum]